MTGDLEAIGAVSPAEEKAEGYLKSLTASEELAVFLSIRGMCLREQGRLSEALESFAAAAKLAPGCPTYRQVLDSLEAAGTCRGKNINRGPKHPQLNP